MDPYFKIQPLAESGADITLHYFDYKKGRDAEPLKPFCEAIFTYTRKQALQSLPFSKPHIVSSRINRRLIARLNADDAPVLLEGIHCTGIIPYLKNKARTIVVRLHNNEAVYYQHLAQTEKSFWRRLFFKRESALLEKYQQNLSRSLLFLTVCKKDCAAFQAMGYNRVFVLPPFLPWQMVQSKTGKGSFALYQGNLSVSENEAAVVWLLETVFSQIDYPVVIAGKTPSQRLQKIVEQWPNARLVSNPTETELAQLIETAHVHVLPDLNQTGIKLKLLHALFCGRFCITNHSEFAANDTLALAQTATEYMGFLKSFIGKEFSEAHRQLRVQMLHDYNNTALAQQLSARLW